MYVLFVYIANQSGRMVYSVQIIRHIHRGNAVGHSIGVHCKPLSLPHLNNSCWTCFLKHNNIINCMNNSHIIKELPTINVIKIGLDIFIIHKDRTLIIFKA